MKVDHLHVWFGGFSLLEDIARAKRTQTSWNSELMGGFLATTPVPFTHVTSRE